MRSPPILSSLFDYRDICLHCYPTHESEKQTIDGDIPVSQMLDFVPKDQAVEKGGEALEGERCFIDEQQQMVVDGEERVFAQGTGGLVC
jgi:hypothetical protein